MPVAPRTELARLRFDGLFILQYCAKISTNRLMTAGGIAQTLPRLPVQWLRKLRPDPLLAGRFANIQVCGT